ncbi:MAG: hypothetical protein F4Y02_15390 [Chloroflexi bacterium]|nr:hypothetical protein [Chloroflexota bacterium]
MTGPCGAREVGPALESRHRFVVWLVPVLERFPRAIVPARRPDAGRGAGPPGGTDRRHLHAPAVGTAGAGQPEP